MSSAERFESAYVGVLAVVWDSLEQIAERLERVEDQASERAESAQLEDVRLELLLWKDASRLFAQRVELSERQCARLAGLVRRVDALLAVEGVATTGALRERIWSAQNCIYEDACPREAGVSRDVHVGSPESVTRNVAVAASLHDLGACSGLQAP